MDPFLATTGVEGRTDAEFWEVVLRRVVVVSLFRWYPVSDPRAGRVPVGRRHVPESLYVSPILMYLGDFDLPPPTRFAPAKRPLAHVV